MVKYVVLLDYVTGVTSIMTLDSLGIPFEYQENETDYLTEYFHNMLSHSDFHFMISNNIQMSL